MIFLVRGRYLLNNSPIHLPRVNFAQQYFIYQVNILLLSWYSYLPSFSLMLCYFYKFPVRQPHKSGAVFRLIFTARSTGSISRVNLHFQQISYFLLPPTHEHNRIYEHTHTHTHTQKRTHTYTTTYLVIRVSVKKYYRETYSQKYV